MGSEVIIMCDVCHVLVWNSLSHETEIIFPKGGSNLLCEMVRFAATTPPSLFMLHPEIVPYMAGNGRQRWRGRNPIRNLFY